MFRNTFLILACCCAAALAGSACQSAEKTDANSAAAAKTATNAPPEFSGAITNDANVAAADPNAPKMSNLPKGATPTPGIPSEAEIKRQMSPQAKKTPPIPGIPSQEELRRQMNTPVSNQRVSETKPPAYDANSAPQNPVDQRPRKVRKP